MQPTAASNRRISKERSDGCPECRRADWAAAAVQPFRVAIVSKYGHYQARQPTSSLQAQATVAASGCTRYGQEAMSVQFLPSLSSARLPATSVINACRRQSRFEGTGPNGDDIDMRGRRLRAKGAGTLLAITPLGYREWRWWQTFPTLRIPSPDSCADAAARVSRSSQGALAPHRH